MCCAISIVSHIIKNIFYSYCNDSGAVVDIMVLSSIETVQGGWGLHQYQLLCVPVYIITDTLTLKWNNLFMVHRHRVFLPHSPGGAQRLLQGGDNVEWSIPSVIWSLVILALNFGDVFALALWLVFSRLSVQARNKLLQFLDRHKAFMQVGSLYLLYEKRMTYCKAHQLISILKIEKRLFLPDKFLIGIYVP